MSALVVPAAMMKAFVVLVFESPAKAARWYDSQS
jgi:hypothetical protein